MGFFRLCLFLLGFVVCIFMEFCSMLIFIQEELCGIFISLDVVVVGSLFELRL